MNAIICCDSLDLLTLFIHSLFRSFKNIMVSPVVGKYSPSYKSWCMSHISNIYKGTYMFKKLLLSISYLCLCWKVIHLFFYSLFMPGALFLHAEDETVTSNQLCVSWSGNYRGTPISCQRLSHCNCNVTCYEDTNLQPPWASCSLH